MRAVLPLFTAALAVALPTKSITLIAIEALHEGSGMEITNMTVVVPVGPSYVNEAALREVSALYILEDDATSCIPYDSQIAFGPHGNPFTFGHPTIFSNTTAVGSIICTRN